MITISENLSRNQSKCNIFGGDPYFRDSWDTFLGFFENEKELGELLNSLALLVIRPDAIISGKVNVGLQTICLNGFRPIAYSLFKYDRLMVREGWRYQLNIATRERIDVMDMILIDELAILVLFKDEKPKMDVPASVRLSSLKGPSLPERRKNTDLRCIFGDAQESVLTFIHISDEPADVVRELGVFIDETTRERVFRDIKAGTVSSREVLGVCEAVCREAGRHSIIFENVLREIRKEKLSRVSCSQLKCKIDSEIEMMKKGESLDWKRFIKLCGDGGLGLCKWDEIAIASRLCSRHNLSLKPVIPDICAGSWR